MTLPLTGTLLNVATVLVGGALGTALGNRLPERTRVTVLHGLGLMTLVVGISMAITTQNVLIPLFSVLIGAIIGESLGIEAALERLGAWFEARLRPADLGRPPSPDGVPGEDRVPGSNPGAHGMGGDGGRSMPEALSSGTTRATGPAQTRAHASVAQGFITASLVFCVGPLTVLGAIQDGLMGDYTLLSIKSALDGFAAMALAASLGFGVMLSVVTVLGYQGGLSLLAMLFATALGGVTRQTPWVIEMSATGGVVILSISFLLLDVKRIRAANLLPAILIAPLLVLLLQWLRVF